jgi:hypothetical protein
VLPEASETTLIRRSSESARGLTNSQSGINGHGLVSPARLSQKFPQFLIEPSLAVIRREDSECGAVLCSEVFHRAGPLQLPPLRKSWNHRLGPSQWSPRRHFHQRTRSVRPLLPSSLEHRLRSANHPSDCLQGHCQQERLLTDPFRSDAAILFPDSFSTNRSRPWLRISPPALDSILNL